MGVIEILPKFRLIAVIPVGLNQEQNYSPGVQRVKGGPYALSRKINSQKTPEYGFVTGVEEIKAHISAQRRNVGMPDFI